MKIEHIGLWVNDLERMKRFYETYFKASSNSLYKNEKTGFSSYFLTFSTGSRLEIMHKEEIPANASIQTGYAHLALSVGTRTEVDRLTEQLTADGYPLVSPTRVTGDGYYESVIADPEENLIELTTD